MKITISEILDKIELLFPDAGCELNYHNLYELAISVILSAQTTDISVNKVTVKLFEKYPNINSLANAKSQDVEKLIRNLGLYRNKSKNIIAFAKQIEHEFNGTIPNNRDDLIRLAGVGRKTANVILSEFYHVPAIAVDTHVERVSKRLQLAAENDSVLQVELKLQKKIPKERWSQSHHLFIFFGRYQCKAIKPICTECPFKENCTYQKK